jgi:hypothetical protein
MGTKLSDIKRIDDMLSETNMKELAVSEIEKFLKPDGVVCIGMEFINLYIARGIAEELGIEVMPNYKDKAWEFSYGICSE